MYQTGVQTVNKRIEELAEQAGYKPLPGFDFANSLEETYLKKFAELIVRECVQTLRDNTPVLEEDVTPEDWDKGYIRAMVDCEHHIREHFGVER